MISETNITLFQSLANLILFFLTFCLMLKFLHPENKVALKINESTHPALLALGSAIAGFFVWVVGNVLRGLNESMWNDIVRPLLNWRFLELTLPDAISVVLLFLNLAIILLLVWVAGSYITRSSKLLQSYLFR